ncbi:MAG: hypothetical protein QM504_15135 [Pseudomonadota bacterium]
MLDWSRFESLTGAATENFEKLCRAIVRRQFGFLGPLHELKNHPGVEFYVKLNQDDKRLGNIGQIVGWQCKWFQYKADGHLTSNAKSQIEHSLDRTREHLPDLFHWILWTHKTLSKPDQNWYYGLKDQYGFELHLWKESDLDTYLSGSAIDLRQSYFGELALTPLMLVEQHEISVAPIKARWLHNVHQIMDMEHEVRKILGEPSAWLHFESTMESLLVETNTIMISIDAEVYKPWHTKLEEFTSDCTMFSDFCLFFKKNLSAVNIEQIEEMVDIANNYSKNSIQKVLRQLRRNNLSLSLAITNALALIKDTKYLLESSQELLSHQFIAIVADAGGGKTQFAAEITAPCKNRPAGILLLGRSLKAGHNLDSMVNQIIFYNQPVSCFTSLIAAVDAVGTREGCRLPIVIDGLNEAQDPREWKPLLEEIRPVLQKFKNVVLICTLRTGERSRYHHVQKRHKSEELNSRESFSQQALPDNSHIIESKGFDRSLTIKAINSYFNLYKIDAEPFMAPLDFFSHPLNLKIFCDVTNRKAEKIVKVIHFPSSINSLFKEQIKHSASTIALMTNLAYRYQERDIHRSIYLLGELMWEVGTRSIHEDIFVESFNIPVTGWEENIVNLLAQEGLLFRDPGDQPYSYLLSPLYDRLGGFFIADYLLSKNRNINLLDWMQEEVFIQKLLGDGSEQHELSEDILYALIALAPKYQRSQQVWQVIPPKYVPKVLSLSYLIDHQDFCNKTKDAYKQQILIEKISSHTFDQLRKTRTVVKHPLNADFLSEILGQLSMADRDLSWTEYNRIYHQDRIKALKQITKYWRNNQIGNAEVERLKAVSISWLLTSTCIELRDLATESLFFYGLQAPEQLFKITINSLNINDPYISERLLAASYGVATTLLLRGEGQAETSKFATLTYKSIFVEHASFATTHLLTREYASGILQVVCTFIPDMVNKIQLQAATNPFPLMPRKKWGVELIGKHNSRYESPFRMDFENYTIGRLISERRNYDNENTEYKNIRGKILWRIKELGWDDASFSNAEGNCESNSDYSRGNRPKIERYGKKYSWIAYYEMAGQLEDEGKLESWGEKFAADIDPFFPINILPTSKESIDFLGNDSVTTKQWICDSELPYLDSTLAIRRQLLCPVGDN